MKDHTHSDVAGILPYAYRSQKLAMYIHFRVTVIGFLKSSEDFGTTNVCVFLLTLLAQACDAATTFTFSFLMYASSSSINGIIHQGTEGHFCYFLRAKSNGAAEGRA